MAQLPITISGNLIDDPKHLKFKTGTTLTKLRVATSRRVSTEEKDDNGNTIWQDIDQLYLDVECWGQLAVNVKASLKKGLPVIVVGRLVTESWDEPTDGEETITRYRTILKANQIALELSRHQASWKATNVAEHSVEGLEAPELKTAEDLDDDNVIRKTITIADEPGSSLGGVDHVDERVPVAAS